MITYELTNSQRVYFGLDPIQNHWERVTLKSGLNIPESILYFDKDTIKKHIISTDNNYFEKQYNDQTKNRTVLLPKTVKGKEKRLTTAVLEQRQPTGIYLNISCGSLKIANYNTQTTFYSSSWVNEQQSEKSIPEIVESFINHSQKNHFEEIEKFKNAKRQNVKFKSGDYFCFKLDIKHYGFGRILLDVNKIRKKNLIGKNHGLSLLMGPPVIVELFAYTSDVNKVDIETLDGQPKLPSDVMTDNLLFYGEYEIIGHRDLDDEEFSFPISYGRSIDQRPVVFLQWGLIHKELPKTIFNKYIYIEDTQTIHNPYGYYGIGSRPNYESVDVIKTVLNKGYYNFDNSRNYKSKWDLRNPKNMEIRNELFKVFGLDSQKNYYENSLLTETILPSEINKQLK